MSQSSTTHYLAAVFSVLFVFLFLFPTTVAAIPIHQYQQNLQSAIASLESLNEPGDDFDGRLAKSIELVRTTLPRQQTVEFEGQTCNVDNAWVHKYLDELDQADDPSEKLTQILWSLRALEARVAERQNPSGTAAENKEWAKTRLESILARPEYATGPQGSSALARLLQDVLTWLAKFWPKRRVVSGGRLDLITLIAQIIIITLAVLVIGYVIKTLFVRFSGRSRRPRTRKREARIVLGERLEPDATATDLLSEAESLARQGDLRAAIRKAYIALLVELGDRKLISLAHHKTNRDYLNSLRSVPQLHSRIRGLTDSFERHWYGFADVTPNEWQDFRADYLAALQREAK
ncbi:MAG TPA: DUF4129 domain-containing protein [Pyrinomonadaceae bacterium]|nr:DUF4129 domain-containing protein [Pyrinomonadaceae bacterium]